MCCVPCGKLSLMENYKITMYASDLDYLDIKKFSGDYSDINPKSGVLLLTNFFENTRNICMETYV